MVCFHSQNHLNDLFSTDSAVIVKFKVIKKALSKPTSLAVVMEVDHGNFIRVSVSARLH